MMAGFNVAVFVSRLFRFYEILIIVWCMLSWFPLPRDGVVADIASAIDRLVSPYMNIFRRIIPPIGGAGMSLDISPILAIIVLGLIQRVIMSILLGL